MRQREFESHLVLSRFFDNPVLKYRAHDVAVAYRLAMAEVRVQLPLGALGKPGVCIGWRWRWRVGFAPRGVFAPGESMGFGLRRKTYTRNNVQAESADDRRSTLIGYRSKRSFGGAVVLVLVRVGDC